MPGIYSAKKSNLQFCALGVPRFCGKAHVILVDCGYRREPASSFTVGGGEAAARKCLSKAGI